MTPIGAVREWRPATAAPWLFPLMFSTAHPAVDPETDELYSVSFVRREAGQDGRTDIVRWRRGLLRRTQLVDEKGAPVRIEQSLHQLALTERYLVLQESAFFVELDQIVDCALGALGGRGSSKSARCNRLYRTQYPFRSHHSSFNRVRDRPTKMNTAPLCGS